MRTHSSQSEEDRKSKGGSDMRVLRGMEVCGATELGPGCVVLRALEERR